MKSKIKCFAFFLVKKVKGHTSLHSMKVKSYNNHEMCSFLPCSGIVTLNISIIISIDRYRYSCINLQISEPAFHFKTENRSLTFLCHAPP